MHPGCCRDRHHRDDRHRHRDDRRNRRRHRERHRAHRRRHRDDRRSRRAHRHRHRRGHRGRHRDRQDARRGDRHRWRCDRASCPGWDAGHRDGDRRDGDRPDARRPRRPEHPRRRRDAGHGHPDAACPARVRTGCCPDAADGARRHRDARPDGACPGTARRGCCPGGRQAGPDAGRDGLPGSRERPVLRPRGPEPDAPEPDVPERGSPEPRGRPARQPQELRRRGAGPRPVQRVRVRWGQRRPGRAPGVPVPSGRVLLRGRNLHHHRPGRCPAACGRPAVRWSRMLNGRTLRTRSAWS